MIQITEEQLIELLHKATGNVKDFVMDNEKWIADNLPEQVVNKNDLLHIVRVSTWDDATEGEKSPFIERAEELAQDTLFCSRVWSAWGYGTMTKDDFSDATDDFDFIDAIAKAIWEGY